MSEFITSATRPVTLGHIEIAGMNRLAAMSGCADLTEFAARQPQLAYQFIRTKWRRMLAFSEVTITMPLEVADGTVHDGRVADKAQTRQWIDAYLPQVYEIDDPLTIQVHALAAHGLRQMLRRQPVPEPVFVTEFEVTRFEF